MWLVGAFHTQGWSGDRDQSEVLLQLQRGEVSHRQDHAEGRPFQRGWVSHQLPAPSSPSVKANGERFSPLVYYPGTFSNARMELNLYLLRDDAKLQPCLCVFLCSDQQESDLTSPSGGQLSQGERSLTASVAASVYIHHHVRLYNLIKFLFTYTRSCLSVIIQQPE